MLCSLSFFGLRKINKKNPHKYIGGKKKKSPNKIKSTDVILCFLFKCLHHAILLYSNIPLIFICITNLVLLFPFKKIFRIIVTNIVQFFR